MKPSCMSAIVGIAAMLVIGCVIYLALWVIVVGLR